MADARYSRADVAAKNGKGGAPAWIIYKDVVYDVTVYANEHPAGKDEIMEEAGKDTTKEFDSAGHSSEARSIMARYRIGELVEEEKHYDANGKKKKKVVSAQPEQGGKSCISIVSCGLLG